MANFPTSVFSPASRSNGQVIDASHVNDLQGEVTAIADGYLNGSARLNSSGSTLTSLNVTGGTTLASLTVTGASTFGAMTLGSLTVTGTSTFAAMTLASLTVTGNSTLAALNAGASTLASLSVTGASTFASRPVTPPPHAALLGRELVLGLTNNTTLAVAWTNQHALTNSSLHSTGTNPSLVTPQSTGIYFIDALVRTVVAINVSTASLRCDIEDSSGTQIGMGIGLSNSDVPTAAHVTGMKRFDALGGSVRLVVLLRSASTQSIDTVASHFNLVKL